MNTYAKPSDTFAQLNDDVKAQIELTYDCVNIKDPAFTLTFEEYERDPGEAQSSFDEMFVGDDVTEKALLQVGDFTLIQVNSCGGKKSDDSDKEKKG